MVLFAARADNPHMRADWPFGHCGIGLGQGWAVRLSHSGFAPIPGDNPLAVYQLSATLIASPYQRQVREKLK
jgi:hypothetical protein